MSYCVNCGVELDASAKKCALCSTAVINPNIKQEAEEAPSPFSSEMHIPEEVKTRFVTSMISVIMLIPNIVCFLMNMIIFKDSFWSLYVMSTSFLLWSVFVFPFFTKKRKPYLMWAIDTIGAILYVYFFFFMGNDSINWFLNAALPIILIISAVVLIYMIWVKKKKRHALLKALHIFIDLAVVSLASGILLNIGAGLKYVLSIGIIAFVSFAVIAVFFAYCYSSKSMRRYLSKKFFV